MRVIRLALCTLAVLAVVPTAASAQQPGAPPKARPPAGAGQMGMMKDMMVGDFERQRKNVLDYLNAAPDSMLTFRSTPGVRTFAQQIHHLAQAQAGILAQVFGTAAMPGLEDTTKVFTDKAALRAYVNASYDYAVKVARAATPAQMMAEKEMFGLKRNGRQWLDGVREHSTWTLGQTVPYLRMNGVTPPGYLPF